MGKNDKWCAKQVGTDLEKLACEYLQQHGLQLEVKNYSCKLGEIDLIMREPSGVLVFVEVRYRKHCDYGGGAESVTIYKQRKIIKAAKCYLVQRGLYNSACCRFDVVAIGPACKKSAINWIKDAFWVK